MWHSASRNATFRLAEYRFFLLAFPAAVPSSERIEREATMMQCYRLIVLGFAVAAAIGLATQAPAQQFPAGRIHLIVPSPAGTPPDTVARIVASEIADSEGWQLVVENKPGAIQTIGLNEILKKAADGYTLGSIALSSTAAPAL